MKHRSTLLCLSALLLLSACLVNSPTSSFPDNRVLVVEDPTTGKMVARSKPCPGWDHKPFEGLENHHEQRFGCADSYNLGKMIDRPGDLVAGRAPGLSEASAGVLGIERYRGDKKKVLINPKDISATSGD